MTARERRTFSGHRMLDDETIRFRERVIRKLVTDGAIGYITEDSFTGKCPVCGGDVAFRFHGLAKRVTVQCLDGCTEAELTAEIATDLRLRERR